MNCSGFDEDSHDWNMNCSGFDDEPDCDVGDTDVGADFGDFGF